MGRAAVLTPQPTIHKATRGPDGKVIRGEEITFQDAVAERLADRNVVVCDGAGKANRRKAQEIENAVGRPNTRHDPHVSAGRYALPHFQQDDPTREGHTFYEPAGKKAARNP